MLDHLGFGLAHIDANRYWVNPFTGRVLPVISGAADGDPDPEPDPPRTFTQTDLDRAAGRARDEGRRSTANDFAADLGCTVDEAKTILDQVREAGEAQKTEAQRARDAADTARADADAEKAAAAADRLAVRVERRLLAAGVPDTALARATRMVTVPADADDTAIAAEIDALKTEIPALFTTTEAESAPPPGVTPPRRPNGNGGGTKTMAELGREGLAKRGWAPTPVT